MASGPGSVPVVQPSVGHAHRLFRKPKDLTGLSTHYRPHSLPDVCPKEPTAPSVVADQHQWTVYNSKVNLPAALNDPRLAKRESDFFTKTWGVDFTEGEVTPSYSLSNITAEQFSAYLNDTAQREKIHERCKNICPSKDDLTIPNLTGNHDKAKEELEQVPKIFMRPDFVLSEPATFSAVLPWSHFSVAGGKSSRDAASSRLLQEKLSHYLDVVEVSIARQISMRSEAFFHAMSSQRELQDQLCEAAATVRALREHTAGMGRTMSRGPLLALRHTVTRKNCVALHGKLKLMAAVQQTQPTVQLLLSTSEFVGALELINTTKEVLQQELQGIHSFRHLGSQLCEMEKLIDKMMVADFTAYSRSDLNRAFEDDSQVLEKDRLQSLVFGLLRQRKLDFLDIYSEEMLQAAKGIIRQCVGKAVSQIEEIDTDTVVRLQDQMRCMTFAQWFELLQNVFEYFLLFLTRIKATLGVIRIVVLEVLDSSQRNRAVDACVLADGGSVEKEDDDEVESFLRPGEAELAFLTHEGLFISDALNDAERCGNGATAQARVQAREEVSGSDSASGTTESSSSREHITNTINILPTGEAFAKETEALCCRRSVSLRGALQSQANRFVHRFHEERKTKLGLLLDTERWKQAEVPAEFQHLVDSIADGHIMLPERKTAGPEEKKPNDFLLVDGQKYAVVGMRDEYSFLLFFNRTVLLLIRMLLEYCQCHFNSRSCQLVLGAGALQVVGLKTITTKNLALVSRCLQLVVHYIPIIRAHFETKLQPKQYSILRHLDHITKDYNDHIAEISAKLVAIMDSLFEKALLKYEVKAPMPSLCFRNLCKQMMKMHEAIYELLPEEQTQMLFLRINASFKLHLKRQLARLGVVNDGGPQHGLVVVDVAFYTENIQALRSLERLDLNMPEIWEQKR
ncbi:Vacuolar protein sorting-associated protein 54 [Bagarius yarrelli]|uniref:Vacuolar protein sorting-associated protein 54 n=1 Tax=Bagarius yarrelli TaxID=175774 RepID=A0A556TL73_BAGYA|nr:Vacuolar protein sorting-associated protein 54 [Bagarius yarrelli]